MNHSKMTENQGENPGKKPEDDAIELEDLEDSYDQSRFRYAGKNSGGEGMKRFASKVKDFLFGNKILIFNGRGREIIRIPILHGILILLLAFWPVLIAVLFALAAGWRCRFTGKDLGKDSVNHAADAFGYTVERMGRGIRNTIRKIKEKKKK